jgi:hypothetical protein
MRNGRLRFGLLFMGLTLFLAVGCDQTTEPKEEIKAPEERVLRVTLLSQTSNPLVGASVVIPLANALYTRTTNSNGQCEFHIPNSVALPSFVVTIIDHSTILPGAVTFPGQADGRYSRRYICRSAPSRIYFKEYTLHHLGNDLYGGPENSQLQIAAEGISITRSFNLSSIPSRMPMLTISARGVQHPTEIRINGTFLASLGDSDSDGDLSTYDFRLPGAAQSLLRAGNNTISIKTGATGLTNDPWDDIEFCALALYD